MSGDVQPRKRKEKRRKKEDSDEIPTNFSSDEQLHVHKDASTGGNICAKILFFLLSFVLFVMIGLVVFEYRGTADDEALVPVSKWAATFDGWLETPVKHHEHADITESGEEEHGESGEHENESAEGEENLSEEAASKEDEDEHDDGDDEEEEEDKESEEEETRSAEEEEDEDEEADKLDDEESEEVDEIEDRDEDEEQEEEEEDEEEDRSEEDINMRGKSEEDEEAEDGDDDGKEEDEDDDVEAGREELDDDDDDDDDEEEEEKEVPAYQRESDETDDLLSEIPGITESDEDQEGDYLGRSDEVIVKQQKIPGVHEKKIKAVSEEETDVPRRKQEKQVSETTQPVEGTSTVTVGQKSHEQHKSQDPGQVKLKDHQSAVKQKAVTEKPIVAKPEKSEGHHHQDLSKNKHQTLSTEHPTMKNDGFPSGPGGSGQGHKAEDVTASKVMPSEKPKVDAETTKDGPSAATLPKKQKDDTGPALKSEQLPTNPSKPIISGGKNFKDKDSPSDGVHSPPKASRSGDKVEHSQKGGESGRLHKVKEQSSPSKLDANDKVPDSKSPRVDRSTEEHKETVERKDKLKSKSVPSVPASGAKNNKLETKDAQTAAEDTVKISDSKKNENGKVRAAGNSAPTDKKVKRASNDKEKDSIGVEPVIKEAGNLNSKAKEVRDGQSAVKNKFGEKKVEKLQKNEGHSSNAGKENNEQITPKLDRHTETVKGVAAKDPSAAKVHEDRTKSKMNVEKQKVDSPESAKLSGDGSSGVSTDQARKASAENTKSRTPEKSADVNAAKKKNVKNNTPLEDTHHSKPRDVKASALPETTLKHSVRNSDSSKIHEVKPSVQSASSRRNNQDEEVRPTRKSEDQAGHQKNSGNNKPVNPNIKMSSHSQKVSSKQTESEKTTRK